MNVSRRFIWLAATVAVVFATYVWQLRAPFELQDDHRIISPVLHPGPAALSAYVTEIRGDFEEVGRFRPVNQIFDVIGPHVLGPSPVAWHVCLLLLTLAVTVLLFLIGDGLFSSPAAGAVLSLTTMLAPDPGPTSAWYRLGPKEAWGMLFLALAVLVMVRRGSDRVAFVFVALAAYSKEAFLLTVPALFGFRWWLDARRSGAWAALRQLRRTAVAYALLFLLGLACVFVAVRSAGARSYGARSLALAPAEVGSVLVRDLFATPLLAAWFVPFALSLFVRRPSLLAAGVFAAWIGPQYLLHATRGGFWDHYWIPCVVAFAVVNAAAIASLSSTRWLHRLAWTVLGLWTLNALRTDVPSVLNHVEKARVEQEAVRIAAEKTSPSSELVIVHDPEVHSETAPSFAAFVRAAGGTHRRAVLVTRNTLPAHTARAGVIVFLDTKQDDAMPKPGWQRIAVDGNRMYVSLRKATVDRIPFQLNVDVAPR